MGASALVFVNCWAGTCAGGDPRRAEATALRPLSPGGIADGPAGQRITWHVTEQSYGVSRQLLGWGMGACETATG